MKIISAPSNSEQYNNRTLEVLLCSRTSVCVSVHSWKGSFHVKSIGPKILTIMNEKMKMKNFALKYHLAFEYAVNCAGNS